MLVYIAWLDLSHTCNHTTCVNVYDMCIETNKINVARHHHLAKARDLDYYTSHTPLCDELLSTV